MFRDKVYKHWSWEELVKNQLSFQGKSSWFPLPYLCNSANNALVKLLSTPRMLDIDLGTRSLRAWTCGHTTCTHTHTHTHTHSLLNLVVALSQQ